MTMNDWLIDWLINKLELAIVPLHHRMMADYCSMVRWHNDKSKPVD